ncbi:MAG: SMC-Scp complex subunit ScpB [Treponema sp.]|nr:SMC-Scp complex subunit ScpB [Treponema sp.]
MADTSEKITNPEKDTALIEAILYLETDLITVETLNRITGIAPDAISGILNALTERYQAPDCGIEIAHVGNGYMVSPRKEFWEDLKDRYGAKNEGRISRAAMETLSIIAYSQPVTRSEIEAIRGVSADNMIRLLLEKELIREVGKKDIPGKPVQFGTTKEFLKQFHLSTIADLPRLNDSEADRFELDGDQ